MHLKAYYQDFFVGKKSKVVDIDQPGGAFVFHQNSQMSVPMSLPPNVTSVLLPELPPGLAKTPKAAKFTAKVLRDMTLG